MSTRNQMISKNKQQLWRKKNIAANCSVLVMIQFIGTILLTDRLELLGVRGVLLENLVP